MARHRDYGALDDPPLRDGDGFFVGVDMRRDPLQVAPGFVALARNCRFDGKVLAPRKGVGLVQWGNEYATDWPLHFPIHFDHLVGFGDVLGAGIFTDPVKKEWVLIGTPDGVFVTKDGFPLQRLELPAGVTLDGPVFFQQAGSVLYMFRGADRRKLQWTHTFLGTAPWVEGFELVELADLDDNTEELPDAAFATLTADRVWVPVGKDEYAHSDLLDYMRHHPVQSVFKLDPGAGHLVRLWPFPGKAMLAFRNSSVFLLTGVTGDLSAMNEGDPITTEIGLKAPLTVVEVGKDVWFLADTGVYSIRQVASADQQTSARPLATALPVSEPIQPLIDRISWGSAAEAVAAVWDNKYYLAVPLDGAIRNNAVLVYDIQNGAWCGYDDGAAIAPKAWLKAQYRGKTRLLMIDYDGRMFVYDEHFEDETADGFVGIETEWLTRGYACETPDDKIFGALALDLETWAPSYSIGVEAPGITR